MTQNLATLPGRRLTFPRPGERSLTTRASALVFEDPSSVSLLGDIERIAARDVTALAAASPRWRARTSGGPT